MYAHDFKTNAPNWIIIFSMSSLLLGHRTESVIFSYFLFYFLFIDCKYDWGAYNYEKRFFKNLENIHKKMALLST